ncbi:NAD-dependent epimerase/dehydratase family protein [Pseudobutyrivibrio sp.]|uniref:NAD-dependent epimerase/dehydratase family protein n=2 Tax=Pseudobutyrivibrio sp. TaxID=2014367 RepID=UPI0025FD6010|nr:NAD(P)-dependent oxidoreductase [Pseudobutyrivibrio sp.]MBR5648304.1 NAD(P)-dependent oxidoreductase [Pseudobutyrivibrio sp.]
MNVLVTGSNGFIGYHVCDYLKEKDFFIIGLGRSEQSKAHTDKYYSCDMCTPEVEEVFANESIDAVVHLAADMRREPYTTEVIMHNCVGTERILKFCTKYNVKVFTELSSLPVIGAPIEHPITENHPLRPYTVYHVTKVMEEMLAEYATDMFGLRTSSFRISAPVGIGMNSKTIFSVFVENAVNNKPIVLAGKGGRKQTYIHVKDIAQALYLAITNENAQGVYNLSSHNILSNKDLAEEIIQVTGSKSEIQFNGKEDKEENRVWDVSLEKIKKEIGYEPKVNIDEAIKELADYFREK